ncbi:hypothetical protein E0H68_06275 [Rhizobium leguminosarum bv. viciae]|uniref:hypothetical protein n=1 Tax=Rhizobium leguminosarum TaxID=384 RepID=UPI001038E855|nr:hypothetical protein [Rhizobium leguminosarum]TCA17377.1 hypothetical protein E0H68_06275 [Rhizobium leguminosarum bv. viciae]
MTLRDEAKMALAYDEGVSGLSAAFDKDLGALLEDCLRLHRAGTKRMRKPTLRVWADTDDVGKIGIRLLFADSRKRILKGEMYYTFPYASYQEVADMVGKLRPMLCEHHVVAWLVQSARPRLESKHFGVAA